MWGVNQRVAPQVKIPAPFLELAKGDPVVLNQVVRGFEKVIRNSFAPDKDPVRGGTPTASHVRERFVICERIFRALRNDKQWGVQRILDKLPEYLHCELNGQSWEPDNRSVWVPSDGR